MEPLFPTCEEKRRRWLAHQESTQQERSINELVIDCKSVFLAELAVNERDGRLASMLFCLNILLNIYKDWQSD